MREAFESFAKTEASAFLDSASGFGLESSDVAVPPNASFDFGKQGDTSDGSFSFHDPWSGDFSF